MGEEETAEVEQLELLLLVVSPHHVDVDGAERLDEHHLHQVPTLTTTPTRPTANDRHPVTISGISPVYQGPEGDVAASPLAPPQHTNEALIQSTGPWWVA